MRRSDVVLGGLAGYAASRTMDVATTWFHARQSDESRRREEELAPGGTLVQIGKQLGATTGRELGDEQAGRVGLALHRTLGVTYGVAAAWLSGRGVPPLQASLAVAAAAFVLVDEGTSIAHLTDYPIASHMRGVVGHATLGLTAGLLLSLAGGSSDRRT